MVRKLALAFALLFSILLHSQIVINELDADNPGTDTLEFIELKSTTPNFSLNGYVLVFFNGGSTGTSNLSYKAIDLDGYITDINGIFLIGCSQVSPTPNYIISSNTIQNGPDAIAIYHANDTDFPINTIGTTTNLINALAYSSSSTLLPTTLMTALGITNCGIDNTTGNNISIQFNADGTYTSATPNPGQNNDGSGTVLNHITITPSATTINEGNTITFTFTTETPVTGSNLIMYMSINNGNFDLLDIDGTLTVTIPIGQTSATNTLLVVNDIYNEGDEEMVLNVQSIPTGYVLNNNFITVRVNESHFDVLPFGTPANPTYGNIISTAPIGYYNSLEGLSGVALKQELQNIIANPSVVRVHNYDDIWEILKTADQNPENSNQVWLIYTETPRSKIDLQSGSSVVGKWNREHIYCQSRGGYSAGTDYLTPNADGINNYNPTTGANDIGAGVCDAHHIRAVDGQENSSRNNRNYGVDYNGPSTNPTITWKGDVARACLYMAVRYNGLNVVYGNPTDGIIGQIGDLATLLTWNHTDIADDFEMNRNNYIYTWQKNRNPFIDYPLLADYIWGTHAGEVWHASLSNYDFINHRAIIYPNPAKDNFSIVGLSKNSLVSFYTILGAKLFEQKVSDQATFDISNYASGVYILKIQSDGLISEKKIIKE
jgi:endonuclease I